MYQQLEIETCDISKNPVLLSDNEKALLNRFKRIIAMKSIAWCDNELFEYLRNSYLFCDQNTTYEDYREKYWGKEGFKRFVVHFVRPQAKWAPQHVLLNNEIHQYVIENVGEILEKVEK